MPTKTAPTYASLALRVAALQPKLRRKKLTVATAESCTGGLLAAVLSEVAGASDDFLGGGVVYSNVASHGAVSSVVAGALARGARARLGAKVGLGITGIAGPGGATAGKPVGLTYVAIDSDAHRAVKKHTWSFDRAGNRLASVGAALDLLEELVG